MKTNKGFSLVELIVVIAIMAVIAGVAIPVYTNYIDKTNKAADEKLFDDIMDVLTYAAVADTSGQTGYLGAVVLGENGANFATYDSDANNPIVTNAITAAEFFNLALKYDGWDASQANNAEVITDSTFFNSSSDEERKDKVQGLLNNIQTLVDAIDGLGSGLDGNNAVFGVAETTSGLTSAQYDEVVRRWATNNFTTSEPSTYFSDENGDGFTTNTGLTTVDGEDTLTLFAMYYANLKAMVMYLESISEATENIEGGNFKTYSGLLFDEYTRVINDMSLRGESAIDIMNILASMFVEVPLAAEEYDEDLYVQYKNLSQDIKANDAKAFLSTLSIASSKKEEFDLTKDNLFASDEMVNYIDSNVATMGGISGIVVPEGSSVVISVVKDDAGVVSLVIYK